MEMEVQSADDFAKIYTDQCRICLKRAVEICEIFTHGDAITRKLMAVASVQVEEGDGLPPVICSHCIQLLDASYDFQLQIRTSDEKLRQLLKLKTNSNSNFSSASIVKAIIADVISSVISSEQETPAFSEEIKQECVLTDEIQDSELKLENSLDNLKFDEEEKPLIWRTSRLRCSQCIKSFRSKVALQRHQIVHKRKTKLRYVCHVCDKQYNNVGKLKSHVAICHEKSVQDKRSEEKRLRSQKPVKLDAKDEVKKPVKFECKVCAKQFTYQKSFETHARSHTDYKNEDSNCEKPETVEEEDEENENENEDDEEEEEDEDMPAENLQCTQCGKLFATKRNLKRHISTHSGLKYNCTTCGKGFSRVDKLKDHEQTKHKAEMFESSDQEEQDADSVHNKEPFEGRKKDRHNRPHKCALCPKSFAQAQSLSNHMERHKRVKETQKRFLCEVCSKCFAQSGSLVAHMRTHTGVKPYVCNVCSRAFTKSTYLQLHLRTHSGEKPYICQYCSRAFARANTLARHITMHTGEAKYHCQICTKSFRRLTSLNEHTYTHTGQRPYACKICTKRYNNAGSLYAHRKKCKAQMNSGFTVSVDTQQQESVSQVLIYSQRKLVEDATVGQVTPTPQYMIANVHNQKNIIQPFGVDEQNVYAINSKQFKNPYYTIYPNM